MANFQVFIYPNDYTLLDDAETVESGVKEALATLESHGSILDSHVEIRYDMPKLPYYKYFKIWREPRYDDPGTHLWLTGSYGSGIADAGNANKNAWNHPMDAKIHTSTADYHGFKQELALQEIFHPYLWDSQIGDWIDDDEHDLGSIHYDGGWRLTPMACSYEETHLHHGTCNPPSDYSGYTPEPTYCTKEALKACNPEI